MGTRRIRREVNTICRGDLLAGMSDAVDELDFWGQRLLRQTQTNPLRAEMREFIKETTPNTDVKEVRRKIGNGTPLSELVDEGREERL